VTLREFPGALALGLLAALVAHTLLYGGGHVIGGAYHELLLQAAMAGSLGLLVLFGSLAWSGAAHAADGSILAARVSRCLPGQASTLAATSLWYMLAERIEPHHDASVSVIALALALAAAAWLVLRLAHALVRLLAGAVITVSRSRWAPRAPRWIRRAPSVPIARRSPLPRRRFARPPPSVAICCA
jgi:hypothetical protein